MRQRGRDGRCRLRSLGASPRGTSGPSQSLPVRAGLTRTRVAAAELPRAAGHLFAASGYQECEDQPLLELINSAADSTVPVRPRIRPAHCTVPAASSQRIMCTAHPRTWLPAGANARCQARKEAFDMRRRPVKTDQHAAQSATQRPAPRLPRPAGEVCSEAGSQRHRRVPPELVATVAPQAVPAVLKIFYRTTVARRSAYAGLQDGQDPGGRQPAECPGLLPATGPGHSLPSPQGGRRDSDRYHGAATSRGSRPRWVPRVSSSWRAWRPTSRCGRPL